jgi:N-methylhydantoinase A
VRDLRVGVDVGGTFTDLAVVSHDGVQTAKVPSTPRDQSEGVLRCLADAGVPGHAVAFFAHGTTVATNALLERRGARTALVTTEGFRDVIEIGRQNRPALYDLALDRPPPLVPRERRLTVRERTGPSGPLRPLDASSVAAAVEALRTEDVQAVAVCLLFGFLHPEHERSVRDAILDALPAVLVSISSEVLPEFREYERMSTTVANAYLAPSLGGYAKRLTERVRERRFPRPLVMQSSGGVVDAERAPDLAAACLLSGPAAGVVGAARVAGMSGFRDVLTLDMGGTSTDVSPVIGGDVATTTSSVVAGVPIGLPAVDVHTVGAGGGSIAWVDPGGMLRVGPQSAGADPGPAAYGFGGADVTVTDAGLLLGYLADGARLGGAIVLERAPAERAMKGIADRLGIDVTAAARGVIDVANAEMVRALRLVSVQRGLDPRAFVLVAFGGAGPMHACALAEELGMPTVAIPRVGGVLSALGLAGADLRRDYVTPCIGPLEELSTDALRSGYERMRSRAHRDLPSSELRLLADLRYRGQSFELMVEAGEDPRALSDAFHSLHERRYGYRMDDAVVEVVNLRLSATITGALAGLSEPPPTRRSRTGTRSAWFDGGWHDVPVHDRRLMGRGSEVEGPAVVEFPEATCIVRPTWDGTVDPNGSLVLRRR